MTPHKQASFGELDTLKKMLEEGAKGDEQDERGFTPLCWAARNGHIDVLDFLIKEGFNKETASFGGLRRKFLRVILYTYYILYTIYYILYTVPTLRETYLFHISLPSIIYSSPSRMQQESGEDHPSSSEGRCPSQCSRRERRCSSSLCLCKRRVKHRHRYTHYTHTLYTQIPTWTRTTEGDKYTFKNKIFYQLK